MKITSFKNIIITILLFTIINYSFTRKSKVNSFSSEKEFLQIKDSLLYKKHNLYKLLYEQEEYTKALEKSLQLIQLGKDKNDIEIQFSSTFLVAKIFEKTKNYKKAINYYKDCLRLINDKKNIDYNFTNNDEKLAKTLLGIGSNYSYLNDNANAEKYYREIIAINALNQNIESIKAKAYVNLSVILINSKKLEEAKKNLKKAIKIHENTNNKPFQASALNNLASIYLIEENYEEAKKIYFQGLELVNQTNSINATKFKEELFYNLAWTLYLLKDYKAYEYQEKAYDLKDNLRDSEVRKMIEKIHSKQIIDLEKEKNNLVKNQTELIKAKDDKTTLLFGALSLLVIVISGGLVYNYKLRKDNLQLKLSENSLKQQQSIEKIKSDAQTKILNATIDGKESERKQIAETLHDNVSALLSSANMHLSATKKQFKGVTPLEIEKTQAIILEASQKVRDLSHNLVSSILLKFGLEYALKDVAKKFSNSELKFKVSALNINRYNQEFEIKVFNIIQELANNILKHSKANYAQIIIKQEKNQLTVLVNDDGVGFSTSSSSFKNNGIGLNQIEARIEMMNGKFTINSEDNKGTKVSIIIPIQQQKPFQFSSVS
ncbi:tetratricopeptide repeat protein [Tenacibaculum sp. AHE15PA]|uniref:tetratricopeptide repeat-containing sensor histidine kinase n=1 Tax=Tenacibaculum TaxID=104267 RepID=UPI001C4F9B60|nr:MULTISPECIES: tetratricopeptide repeat protein [Tenacibaculum]QXP74501.1 tetratricopeptide repeat protein [Tenacibaculum sp. AHE14PA]QXP75129.1 tetratricopeptide repeat protein [Tenacibaculum sp. AHE15PA]